MSKLGLSNAVRETRAKNATGFKALGIVLKAAKQEKIEYEKTKQGKNLFLNLKSKILQVKERMDIIAGLKLHKLAVLKNLLEEQSFQIRLDADNKKEKMIRDLFSNMTSTLNQKITEIEKEVDSNFRKIEKLSKKRDQLH